MDSNFNTDKTLTIEETIERVYEALLSDEDTIHDPAMQFAGYILSEDPLYMPCNGNARGLISHIDRDEFLKLVIEYYLEHRFENVKEKILRERNDKND